MNQLGGIEPGHSMFGGRWNRGDGLSRHLEEKHLVVKIKHDENNGVIIPLEKRLVRSTRVRSTPYDYNLYLLNETETEFTFSINPTWFINYHRVKFLYTYIDNILCEICSDYYYFNYDNYSFITNKNNQNDIKTVRVIISFSVASPEQPDDFAYDTFTFTWVRP